MTFKKGHAKYPRKKEGELPPQSAGIVGQLGALLYYDEKPNEVASFEKLSQGVKDTYTDRAADILIMLDKLNKRVIDKREVEQAKADEAKYHERLVGIIREFVSALNNCKPELFPHEELAFKILQGGK